MESEVDLDEDVYNIFFLKKLVKFSQKIRKFSVLAAYPDLIPDFIATNVKNTNILDEFSKKIQ